MPFLLVHHGFSVEAAASITALGLSANLWRFIWAPLVDLTLSLHKWYLIGLALCASTLLLLSFIPLDKNAAGFLAVIVLFSQIAATFVIAPVGGFMAKTIAEDKKGRASGWYQVGNTSGIGLGGGAGIWLSTHFSYHVAGATLSIAMLACALPLYFFKSVKKVPLGTESDQLHTTFRDLFKSPLAILQ